MLTQITLYPILGMPLLAWGGLLIGLLLLLVASIPWFKKKGIKFLPISWHYTLAKIAVGLALLHGLLGILIYF